MANQQIVDYVKQSLAQGHKKDDIRRSLIAAAWPAQEIDAAFNEVMDPGLAAPTTPPTPAGAGIFPGVFDMLKSAWEIYKQRFWVIVKLVLIPIATVFVLGAIIAIGAVVFLDGLSNFRNAPSAFFGGGFLAAATSVFSGGAIVIVIAVVGLIFLIAVIIIGLWSQTAMLVAIKDRAENIGAKESLRRAWPKVKSYFWVTILVGFVTIGGFMLAIVPGIIFSVWFSLTIYIFISEDVKGMNALLKSKEYVKGRWGGVFWRFFGFGLLVMIASIALSIIPFVNFVSGLVSAFIFTPLGIIYGFLVYNNLKALKGEFEFVPKKKGLFIGLAIFGILLVLALPLLGIFSLIKNYTSGTEGTRIINKSGQDMIVIPQR